MNAEHTFELVEWQTAPPSEPRFIAAELDSERWEIRKIEVCSDGTAVHFTDPQDLAELPWPQPAEIATDEWETFRPFSLTAETFERLWTQPSLELCWQVINKPSDI